MDPLFQLNSMFNDAMAKRPDGVAWPDRRRHRHGPTWRRVAARLRARRRRTPATRPAARPVRGAVGGC